MITRYSNTVCPACGHEGKPKAVEPGSESLNGALNLIPAAGAIYGSYRMTGSELHCESCGHRFTESLQTKTGSLFGKAKSFFAGKKRQCANCSKWIPKSAATCPSCGQE